MPPLGVSVVTFRMLARPMVQGAPWIENLEPAYREKVLTVIIPPTPTALPPFVPKGIGSYMPQPGKSRHSFILPGGLPVFFDPNGGPSEIPLIKKLLE